MLKEHYTLKDLMPLFGVIAAVVAGTAVSAYALDAGVMRIMELFMGWFFLIFGVLKAINLKAFAEAYQMYDIVAMRSKSYALAYPFIELGLALAYFIAFAPLYTNSITIIVMGISAVGVYKKLRANEKIMCACLGAVFKVPMTWVTLGEDLLMAAMAATMLVLL